jgi:hypothetical protein
MMGEYEDSEYEDDWWIWGWWVNNEDNVWIMRMINELWRWWVNMRIMGEYEDSEYEDSEYEDDGWIMRMIS